MSKSTTSSQVSSYILDSNLESVGKYGRRISKYLEAVFSDDLTKLKWYLGQVGLTKFE